jgi:hypothetical protein
LPSGVFEVVQHRHHHHHHHYYEHDPIYEIVKYFDGKISKYDIIDVINMDENDIHDIMHSQIQLMTDQTGVVN